MNWTILKTSQPILGCFMPRGKGIMFIVLLYLYLCIGVSEKFFFFFNTILSKTISFKIKHPWYNIKLCLIVKL